MKKPAPRIVFYRKLVRGYSYTFQCEIERDEGNRLVLRPLGYEEGGKVVPLQGWTERILWGSKSEGDQKFIGARPSSCFTRDGNHVCHWLNEKDNVVSGVGPI